VPLLFESGWQSRFHEVWCVTADEAVQIQRLMARNHLTREQALQRIAAQMPQKEKARLSNRVIDNSGTLDSTRKKVHTRLASARRKWTV
jgi:dephospho-CoA kinase